MLSEVNDKFKVTLDVTLNPKVARAMKILQSSSDEDANKIMEQAKRISSKGNFKFSN